MSKFALFRKTFSDAKNVCKGKLGKVRCRLRTKLDRKNARETSSVSDPGKNRALVLRDDVRKIDILEKKSSLGKDETRAREIFEEGFNLLDEGSTDTSPPTVRVALEVPRTCKLTIIAEDTGANAELVANACCVSKGAGNVHTKSPTRLITSGNTLQTITSAQSPNASISGDVKVDDVVDISTEHCEERGTRKTITVNPAKISQSCGGISGDTNGKMGGRKCVDTSDTRDLSYEDDYIPDQTATGNTIMEISDVDDVRFLYQNLQIHGKNKVATGIIESLARKVLNSEQYIAARIDYLDTVCEKLEPLRGVDCSDQPDDAASVKTVTMEDFIGSESTDGSEFTEIDLDDDEVSNKYPGISKAEREFDIVSQALDEHMIPCLMELGNIQARLRYVHDRYLMSPQTLRSLNVQF